MTMIEGDLQITFGNAISVRKFDDPHIHGLSHCMKAVDFIVELSNRYWFVEIKDPGNPGTTAAQLQHFERELKSGTIGNSLAYKFRDSFLYEWASGRAHKPVDYFVIIEGVRKSLLTLRIDELKRKIPAAGPGGKRWLNEIVHRIGVFNLATWNSRFPNAQILRLSASGST